MVLDYSMMQWVLSIVLGLSYSRFINTITLLARKRHQIKFDFLLISNLIGMIMGITHLWFRSPGFFNSVEGKHLPFMLVFSVCLIYVTALECLLPSTTLLESNDTIDLREIYFNQKNMFYVAMFVLGLVILTLYIFYPEVDGLGFKMSSKIATFSVHIVLVIMLPAILVISNNYYLHVLNMVLVLLNFVSEIVTYAITMK